MLEAAQDLDDLNRAIRIMYQQNDPTRQAALTMIATIAHTCRAGAEEIRRLEQGAVR